MHKKSESKIKILQENKNKNVFFTTLKVFIALALLTFVIYDYGIEILTKYGDKATVFVSTTKETDDFTMPPITICMQNELKPSILNKYDAKSTSYYITEAGSNENISSVWDDYLNASYLINKDFDIEINENGIPLLVGNNIVGKGIIGNPVMFVVHEYHTMMMGTCYGIESNISIQPPIQIALDVRFKKSLDEKDLPQVFLVTIQWQNCLH